MLLAYWFEETGQKGFPAQVPLAIYGTGQLSNQVKYHHPCVADGMCSGCEQVVRDTFSMDVLTRRSLSARGNPKPPASKPKSGTSGGKSLGKCIPFKTGKKVSKGSSSGAKKVHRRSVDDAFFSGWLEARDIDMLYERGLGDDFDATLNERDLDEFDGILYQRDLEDSSYLYYP